MRHFIFICVAMIALFATNASGTKSQVTDQLQTHYMAVNHQIQPAITPVHFETTAVVRTAEAFTINYISSKTEGAVNVYRNPDYGLCNYSGNSKYIRNTDTLPIVHVQRE